MVQHSASHHFTHNYDTDFEPQWNVVLGVSLCCPPLDPLILQKSSNTKTLAVAGSVTHSVLDAEYAC